MIKEIITKKKPQYHCECCSCKFKTLNEGMSKNIRTIQHYLQDTLDKLESKKEQFDEF